MKYDNKTRVGVLETWERLRTGPRADEKEWDEKLTGKTASALKDKYKIAFDRTKMVPEDNDLCDRLFQAGMEMLLTMGIYNINTHRVCKYTEDEVLTAIAVAPDCLTLGEDRDSRQLKARKFDDPRPPINQGGPTGSPVTEEIFLSTMEAYAREPLVDSIVDGVVNTILGKDPIPGTPYEYAASRAEAVQVREAMARAGRPGMAF
jgi:methylamine--corrinoid protein Co-methyltransferase